MPVSITLAATDEYGAGAVKLEFEHSLASLSKWEAIHAKPFFAKAEKTPEEYLSYFEQMLLTENPPENFLDRFTVEDFATLNQYLADSHTATTFRENPNQRPSNAIVTTEQFYDWMIDFQIPWEAQYWQFDRFLTLIRIRSIKQTKQKPMSTDAQRAEMQRLNELRRKQTGSSG